MTDSFPRQQARTQHFSLGVPRSFQISPDGSRIAFLRSQGGSDPVTCLWVLDLPADPGQAGTGQAGTGQAGTGRAGTERLVADPAAISAWSDNAVTEEPDTERARRERSREQAGGVVAFAAEADAVTACFALAGQV